MHRRQDREMKIHCKAHGKYSQKEESLKPSLFLSCRTLERQEFPFTWESGICFKAHCFLSNDASFWYHHSVVRNQEVTTLTHSFPKSATPLEQISKCITASSAFPAKQILEDKRASNKGAHSPNPN